MRILAIARCGDAQIASAKDSSDSRSGDGCMTEHDVAMEPSGATENAVRTRSADRFLTQVRDANATDT